MPDDNPPKPSLEQQMAWSRTLHVELYKRCWHNVCRSNDTTEFCRCRGACKRWIPPDQWDNPNYCTWRRAMPALQEALRRDLNVWHLGVASQFALTGPDHPDFGFGVEPILRDVQPWQIVKAIALTQDQEAEALTPGVNGKESEA